MKDEKQLAFPFQVLEDEMMSPISERELTATEEFISILLLDASGEKPIKSQQIIERLKADLNIEISFRELKKIMRSLRRHHAFPIITRRAKPAGYWWCVSQAQFEEFERLWESQFYDEMITLQIMKKANYPKLAGQMRLPNLTK